MRKQLIAVAAMFVILVNCIAFAAAGVVTADVLNVRQGPSTGDEIIGKLYEGENVNVISTENNWCKINFGSGEAYVFADYVDQSGREQQPVSRSAVERSKGEAIALYGQKFIGVPYVSGGASPSGFDCSGFTYYVYKQMGYSIPRSSAAQSGVGTSVSKANLEKGDLVFFSYYGNGRVSHVGIYIGDNKIVHSTFPGSTVKIDSLSSSYYVKNYMFAKRIDY